MNMMDARYGFTCSEKTPLAEALLDVAQKFENNPNILLSLRLLYLSEDRKRATVVIEMPEHVHDFMYYFDLARGTTAHQIGTTNAPYTSFVFQLSQSGNHLEAQGVGCVQTTEPIKYTSGFNGIAPYLGNHFLHQLCLGYGFNTRFETLFEMLTNTIVYYYNSTFNHNLDYYIYWPTLWWIASQQQDLPEDVIKPLLKVNTLNFMSYQNFPGGPTKYHEYISSIYTQMMGRNVWDTFPDSLKIAWALVPNSAMPIFDTAYNFAALTKHTGAKSFPEMIHPEVPSLYTHKAHVDAMSDDLKKSLVTPHVLPTSQESVAALSSQDLFMLKKPRIPALHSAFKKVS